MDSRHRPPSGRTPSPTPRVIEPSSNGTYTRSGKHGKHIAQIRSRAQRSIPTGHPDCVVSLAMLTRSGDSNDRGSFEPDSSGKGPSSRTSDNNLRRDTSQLRRGLTSTHSSLSSTDEMTTNATFDPDVPVSQIASRPDQSASSPNSPPSDAPRYAGDEAQRVVSTMSEKPYSSFSTSMKWFIASLMGIAAVFSPISSNIFVPAIPTLAVDFDRTEQDISLAVTIYLVFQAVTPAFIGSASDSFGRRPICIGGLVLYIGANIGLALCPTNSYWLLLVMRAVQATGGSCLISIGAGCVSDVAEPRERGKFMSIFQLGTMLGPALGPLLGGVFAQTLSWRAIFWFLVVATGVVLVPLIFFLPETLRSLVGDGSVPPPRLCSSPQQLWEHHLATKERKRTGEEKVHVNRPPQKKYQPFTAFLILLTPEILLVFIFVSVVYLEFYSMLTVYSTALKNSYGLNELQIGLCYLPAGLGLVVTAIINGRWIDSVYRKEEKRVGGDYRKKGDEFELERVRFIIGVPFFAIFVVACISLGWCLHVRAPLAATLVVNFFVGIGSSSINLSTVYGQDLKPGQGGAVSASLNLVRCLFGAIGTGTIQLMYRSLGAGWTFVLLTGICFVCLPLPLIVLRNAPKWREARRIRKDKKAEKEKEKSSNSSQR